MLRIVPSIIMVVLFICTCATMGKMNESKIDMLSDKCKEEHLEKKPNESKWFNLSTQARTRKKRELNEYRKKRIELYQALDSYKNIYVKYIEPDGTCKKNECRSLDRLRLLIIAGCSSTGESFPRIR